MYRVFDAFFESDSWHVSHADDLKRFYVALNEVVRLPEFNIDDMMNWIEDKLDDPMLMSATDELRRRAATVRAFLEANAEIEDYYFG